MDHDGVDAGSAAWVHREVIDPVVADLAPDVIAVELTQTEESRPGWWVRIDDGDDTVRVALRRPTSGWWASGARATLATELTVEILRRTWGAKWPRRRHEAADSLNGTLAVAVTLASSNDLEDREQAARVLAPYAGRPDADLALRALLTDADGAVVTATTTALLLTGRVPAVELIAYGWGHDPGQDVCDALDGFLPLGGPLLQRFIRALLSLAQGTPDPSPHSQPELRAVVDDMIGELPRWIGDGGYPAYDGHRRGERPGTVVLVCGLPGSGKTTWARESVRRDGGLRFSPDEWMRTLGMRIMDSADRARIEALQLAQALRAADQGTRVVLENGFWPRVERDRIRERCRDAGLPVELVVCRADQAELARRVADRYATQPGAAPVTAGLLEEWSAWFDDPDDVELALFDRAVVIAGP